MDKKNERRNNVIPLRRMVKIPLYSSLRYENGKLTGDVKGYIETPAEWLLDNIKGKEH